MLDRARNVEMRSTQRGWRGALLGQTALCGAISLAAFGLTAGTGGAEPRGTKVISGDITIVIDGKNTLFKQGTDTAILTHTSFDIGADQTVHFQQPNARSLAVNRIIGKDVSTTIAGKLTATGNVWIINPSGVAISKGAEVNVNGLIATTADISDANILAGNKTFTGAPTGSAITNDGTITGGDGSIVLVAPSVVNNGTITTKGSDVALGAGSGFTIDMDGDGLTRFEVKPGDGVKIAHTGDISAIGGSVYMSAESKDTVRGAIVSVGGKIEATRVEEKGGVVYIHGGNGKTEITGTVDASQTKGAGGSITVSGDDIVITRTARLDVSGATDGGSIVVGGGARNTKIISPVLRAANAPADAPLPTARSVTVAKGAVLKANAGQVGNGGDIVMWATDFTTFAGHAEAKGGSISGDGGFLEVSAMDRVALIGTFDLTKVDGANGLVLLDPGLITIDAALAATIAAAIAANTNFEVNTSTGSGGAQDIIMTAPINAATGTGILTLIAGRDIVISQTISDGGTMTLNATAGRDINISAAVDLAGAITLTADRNVILSAAVTSAAAISVTAGADGGNDTITFNAGASISGAGVTLSATDNLTLGNITSTGALSITTSNDNITQGAGTSISASSGVTTVNAGTGAITLTSAGNDFGSGGATSNITVTGGAVSITDANSVRLDGASATSLTVAASGGSVTLAGTITVSGAILASATGSVLLANTASVTTSGGGNITLTADADTSGALTDNIDFAGGASVTADGTLVLNVNAGAITDSGTGTITLGTNSAFVLPSLTFDSTNLVLTASGAVTNSGAVTVAGTTSITTTGDAVTLNVAGNNFGGSVNIDTTNAGGSAAAAVTIVDGTGGLVLGAITASSLDVTSTAGAITDTAGSSINVTGATTLVASDGGAVRFDIILDNSGAGIHDFNSDDTFSDVNDNTVGGGASPVTFDGAAVTISDANRVVIGASTATGDVTIRANDVEIDGALSVGGGTGTLTFLLNGVGTFGAGDVSGATSTTDLGYRLTLDDVENISAGTVRFEADVAGSGFVSNNFDTRGTDATADNFATLQIDVDDVTFAINDGTDRVEGALEVESNTFVRQGSGNTGTLIVTGTTSITAAPTDVSLGSATNDFGGAVNVAAGDVTLTDVNSIVLGDIDATGNATVTALGGTITDDGAGAAAGDDINIAGVTSLSASGAITLDDTFNDFDAGGSGDALNAAGTSITINDSNAIVLGDIDTAGSFTLTAGGDVSDDGPGGAAGDDIDVAGTTSISTSGAITLDDTFSDFATVHAAGTDITLVDANSIVLGDIDAGSGLTVTALAGTISDDGVGNAAGADVDVTGTTSLSASGAITLDDTGTDFGGAVSAAGTDITLADLSSIILGDIDAGGNLTVTAAAGTITDDGVGNVAGADVNVTGTASLSASGAITLDDLGNDFADTSGAGELDATGAAVSITDIDAINLGTVAASSLTLNTSGNVTQTGGGQAIAVTGTSTINATGGDVVLTEATNNFSVLTGTSDSFDIADLSGISLSTVTASDGDLNVNSTGSVTVVSGTTVQATGSIDLISSAAFLVGAIGDAHIVADSDNSGAGTLTLSSAGGLVGSGAAGALLSGASVVLTGGTISSPGDVTATNGTITATATAGSLAITGAATSTGAATFTATTTISVANAANDFGGIVSASGMAVTLVDSNALILGAVTATTLDVTAGGTITDTAGSSINVTGNTTLVATDGGAGRFDIILDNTGAGQHDFNSDDVFVAGLNTPGGGASTVQFDGANVTISDANRVVLGASTATGDVTIRSNDVEFDGLVSVGGGAGRLTFLLNGVGSFGAGDVFGGTTTTDLGYRLTNDDVENISAGTIRFEADQSGSSFISNNFDTRGTDATADNFGTLEIDVNEVIFAVGDGTDFIAGDLDIETNNFVRQGAGVDGLTGTLIVTGTTSITAAPTDVTLASATNDFGGVVNIAGGDATLTDANSIVLGDFDLTGNLTVTALGGTITDNGTGAGAGDDIDVTGATSLSATGAITLDDGFNDFDAGGSGDAVDASGTSITLNDVNSIVLGDIDATGNLTVVADGTITDDGNGAAAGDDINVDGTTSLSASGAIVLDDTFNDFDAVVSGDEISATGSDITINDLGAIVLGDVTASGSLTVTAGGSVTQTALSAVSVAGNTSIDATGFAVTLDNTGNDFADTSGAGEFDLVGTVLTIRDVDGVNLGTVSGTSLTLNAGGNITQTGGGQAVSISGTATINAAGFSVTLTETTNDLTTLTGTAGSYDVAETDGVILTSLTATGGNIAVLSTGSVLASAGTTVSATGNVSLTGTGAGASVGPLTGASIIANSDDTGGGDAILTATAGFVGGGTGSTITGDNVTLSGDSVTFFGDAITAKTGAVALTATGGEINVDGTVTAATAITGTAATDITVENLTAVDLTLTTTDGDVVQTGGTTALISGNTTLTAGGAGQHVDFDETTNDFGTVSASASGDSVSLFDIDDIVLDQIDADVLTLTARGAITDAAGAAIVVTGTTSLTASDAGLTTFFDIVLDSATNDFGTTINAIGDNITLTDANDIVLGDIDAAGGLTVTALAGSITDDGDSIATGDIDVAGVTSLSASADIVLDDLFNDFDSDGAAGAPGDEVDATAVNITLNDTDDINLGDIDATGDMTVTAGGVIIDDGATAAGDGINIGGTASLSATGAITLDDTVNDFGVVNATGPSLTLSDDTGIVLGDISVTGDLSVTADGAITDVGSGVAGMGIEVGGTTSLLAIDDQDNADPLDDVLQDIVLDDPFHDFGTDSGAADDTLGDAITSVNARGANITLVDADAIRLGAITATTLTVTAGGSITDTDGDAITVTGATSLTAQNTAGTTFFDIRLDGLDGVATDRPHDFGSVTFLGQDVSIVDVNALTLSGTANGTGAADPTLGGGGAVTADAGGDLVIAALTADGAVNITTDAALTLTALTAGGDIAATSGGRFRIGTVESTGGAINFETGEFFSIIPGNPVPLTADGNIILTAPVGGFITDGGTPLGLGLQGAVNAIPEGLTFRSATGLIEFDFHVGFEVVDLPGTPGTVVLTFDAPAAAIRVDTGFFAIGSLEFLNEVRAGTLDPFNTQAPVNDPDLLLATGSLGLISDGAFRVRLQNTSPGIGSQDGTGAVVTGLTYLGGAFDGLSLFGTFNGFPSTTAALNGFSGFASALGNSFGRTYPDLVPDTDNTANGCVIGVVSSCTPLGSVIPFLDFDDGRLLSIKFVDPTEDEDDPFSNRGDEEEWE